MKDFKEKVGNLLVVAEAAIEGHGEDCFCGSIRENRALIGVFDGCGGLGSKLLPNFKNHTAAFVSSRLVGGAVFDWFVNNPNSMLKGSELTTEIKNELTKVFNASKSNTDGGMKMRGTMVRDLPTTAAFAVVRNIDNGVNVQAVWAGDSRIYLLMPNGLVQLSIDDLEDEDALSNLTSDGSLTNVISSDGNYTLNCRSFAISSPSMLFACTDGCFGYLKTPMEFEYAILSSLMEARTFEDFKNNLYESFKSVAGDDFSFSSLQLFINDFPEMQRIYANRYQEMKKDYIDVLDTRRDEMTLTLWEKYRVHYEMYLNNGGKA